MEKDLVMQYVKFLNDSLDNPNIVYGNYYNNLINSIKVVANNNQELYVLLNKLFDVKNPQKRIEMVNEYYLKNEKSKLSVEDTIASNYQVDRSQIKSQTLENGKEIFSFYDSKLAREIVLENDKETHSLEKKLEEKNDTSDATEILTEENEKNDIELTFYSLQDVGNHLDQINNLNAEEREKLRFIIANADVLNIVEINIENQIGKSKYGMIFESYYDDVEKKLKITTPEGNYEVNESTNNLEPELHTEEQLENHEEKVQERVKVKQKVKRMLDNSNNSGFVDTLMLSMSTGFLLGVIATLVMVFIAIF